MARLERIWIKRARMGPMDPAETATLVEGKGIVGNANFETTRQVTVISAERWAAVQAALGASVDPVSRRANLLVSGVELEDSRGKTLRVGECVIEIMGETRPCERMDEMHEGLKDALKPNWGGGAWGQVVSGGSISVGDDVALNEA